MQGLVDGAPFGLTWEENTDPKGLTSEERADSRQALSPSLHRSRKSASIVSYPEWNFGQASIQHLKENKSSALFHGNAAQVPSVPVSCQPSGATAALGYG